MHGAELEQLRKEVLETRRAELTRVLDDPNGADWPEAFLQPGRTKRGDSGVALRELAQALGCTSQALRHYVGSPLGVVAQSSKPIDVYDPALFDQLRDHPKIVASRERRVPKLTDKERAEALVSALDEVTAFRLKRVSVHGFRTIEEATIEVDGLGVLVGKNGAGKSSLLTATANGLANASGDQAPERLTLMLDAQWPGERDLARRIGAYMAIQESDDVAAAVIGVVECLLMNPSIVGRPPQQWYATLPRETSELAREIFVRLGEEVHFGSVTNARLVELAFRADTDEYWPPFLWLRNGPRIRVSVIGTPSEDIERQLFSSIPEMTHLTDFKLGAEWGDPGFDEEEGSVDLVDDTPAESDPLSLIRFNWASTDATLATPGAATTVQIDRIRGSGHAVSTLHNLTDSEDLFRVVEELEELRQSPLGCPPGTTDTLFAIASVLGLAGPTAPSSDWFSDDHRTRVRTHAMMHLIALQANRIAPHFVAEAGRIVLLPPQNEATEATAVALVTAEGRVVELDHLSSGIQRWVVLLVDFAAGLARDLWVSGTNRDSGSSSQGSYFDDARHLASSLLDQDRNALSGINVVIADEPELHLHPSAQESVAEWCLETSRIGPVLVATHAPAFLRFSPAEARITRVSRDVEGITRAQPLDGDFLQHLDALAADLGLGRESILQLLRGLVVVEGEADAVVLRRFAGRILDRYRLGLVPIGGHSKARSFADGNLALAIGLPIAVMFDETTSEALESFSADSSAKVSDETKSLARILSMRAKGLQCHPLFFEEPDIIAAIPEATVRRRFRGFDSWDTVKQRWSECEDNVSFKNFVLDSWSVSRRGDLDIIRDLAADRRPSDALPGSIQRTIRELEAWAERLGVRDLAIP
jgi:predicted ATPase